MCINGIGATHTALKAYSYGGHGGGTYIAMNPFPIVNISNTFIGIAGSFVSNMSLNDTMTIFLQVYNGTKVVGFQSDNEGLEQTSFSGFFIGA